MPYSPATVANTFLELSDSNHRPITPLQLQKLIYFSHGWHLALTKNILVNEPFEAFQYGPILPSLYTEFNHQNNPIPQHYRVVEQTLKDHLPAITINSVPINDDSATSIIQFVWDKYGKYDGVKLSAMTHEDRSHFLDVEPGVRNPWKKAWIEAYRNGLTKKEISNNDILKYFYALNQNHKLY